ncbi:glutathione s-transferase [Holotrichia oblita]|uniref:Glutathione s-transferase n=2 Tax=Holotrichia oblita TaxID=644536 RepID=A0ACB9SWS4_HOLOL|nr:glutathione s-transferase [Holotrichia oblita]KAI4459018.1 glutathione s-transferase [Holotrichia oblita]
MSATKLIYFPLKGVGEPIRWLLKYGNIEYEEILIEFADWPKVKPTTPFGQIPLYEENGKKINESIAISRYLGKKLNLAGENDWENLEIDAIVDTINDLRLKLKKYGYEKDEKIKEQIKGPLFNEILPYYMEKIEKLAEANNGYLAINKLTWADFYFIGVLDYFNYMAEMDILENRPVLQKLRENVTNIPAIKEWIAVRPDTWYM